MKKLNTLNNQYSKLNASFLKATAKMEKLSLSKKNEQAELVADKLNNMQERLCELSAEIEKAEKTK